MPYPLPQRVIFLSLVAALCPALAIHAQTRAGSADAPVQSYQGAPPPTDPAYAAIAHQPTAAEVTATLGRVLAYADSATPSRLIDRQTGQEITDLSTPNPNAALAIPADTAAGSPAATHPFQTVSYEWGVTYAGMLAAAAATGDTRFSDFVGQRLGLMAHILPYYRAQAQASAPGSRAAFRNPVRGLIAPHALDDIGAMSAALIKAQRAGIGPDLTPVITTAEAWLTTGQSRLPDGTLARHWPVPETVWADDMYMGVPALAQMGKLTGETRYYDDAVRQVLQISSRLFVPAKGLYRHGWISGNPDSIDIYWDRANGWCLMAMVELLDVLPADHPGRSEVLALLRAQIRGIAALQSSTGLWHQLLDRPDSYLETSGSAMFVFGIAHAINAGWISPVYGSLAQVGWNAVAAQVNAQGQVNGTCVGTNFALDLPYYYFRPTSPYAAHGYGPTLLAGAEMLRLLGNDRVALKPQVGSVYFMSKDEAAKVQR
jgi:unsaturated rhamnogalacturonyl hydrolase